MEVKGLVKLKIFYLISVEHVNILAMTNNFSDGSDGYSCSAKPQLFAPYTTTWYCYKLHELQAC